MNPRDRTKSSLRFLSQRSFPALLVLLLLGLYTAGVYAPSAFGTPILLTMATITVTGLVLSYFQVSHVGLIGTMYLACILVPPLAAAWPLSAVVAFGIYAAVVSSSRRLRQSAGWEGWNPPQGSNLVWTGVVGLLGFALTMGWVWLIRPDLSAQVATVPQASPFALVLLGLAFAVLNSFAEEALFRGVYLHALNVTLGSRKTALVLQAAVFGLMHVRGFPRGLSGMVIAGALGLAFGELRLRTRGILAPWLAHAIVNAFMYLYLVILSYE